MDNMDLLMLLFIKETKPCALSPVGIGIGVVYRRVISSELRPGGRMTPRDFKSPRRRRRRCRLPHNARGRGGYVYGGHGHIRAGDYAMLSSLRRRRSRRPHPLPSPNPLRMGKIVLRAVSFLKTWNHCIFSRIDGR